MVEGYLRHPSEFSSKCPRDGHYQPCQPRHSRYERTRPMTPGKRERSSRLLVLSLHKPGGVEPCCPVFFVQKAPARHVMQVALNVFNHEAFVQGFVMVALRHWFAAVAVLHQSPPSTSVGWNCCLQDRRTKLMAQYACFDIKWATLIALGLGCHAAEQLRATAHGQLVKSWMIPWLG